MGEGNGTIAQEGRWADSLSHLPLRSPVDTAHLWMPGGLLLSNLWEMSKSQLIFSLSLQSYFMILFWSFSFVFCYSWIVGLAQNRKKKTRNTYLPKGNYNSKPKLSVIRIQHWLWLWWKWRVRTGDAAPVESICYHAWEPWLFILFRSFVVYIF